MPRLEPIAASPGLDAALVGAGSASSTFAEGLREQERHDLDQKRVASAISIIEAEQRIKEQSHALDQRARELELTEYTRTMERLQERFRNEQDDRQAALGFQKSLWPSLDRLDPQAKSVLQALPQLKAAADRGVLPKESLSLLGEFVTNAMQAQERADFAIAAVDRTNSSIKALVASGLDEEEANLLSEQLGLLNDALAQGLLEPKDYTKSVNDLLAGPREEIVKRGSTAVIDNRITQLLGTPGLDAERLERLLDAQLKLRDGRLSPNEADTISEDIVKGRLRLTKVPGTEIEFDDIYGLKVDPGSRSYYEDMTTQQLAALENLALRVLSKEPIFANLAGEDLAGEAAGPRTDMQLAQSVLDGDTGGSTARKGLSAEQISAVTQQRMKTIAYSLGWGTKPSAEADAAVKRFLDSPPPEGATPPVKGPKDQRKLTPQETNAAMRSVAGRLFRGEIRPSQVDEELRKLGIDPDGPLPEWMSADKEFTPYELSALSATTGLPGAALDTRSDAATRERALSAASSAGVERGPDAPAAGAAPAPKPKPTRMERLGEIVTGPGVTGEGMRAASRKQSRERAEARAKDAALPGPPGKESAPAKTGEPAAKLAKLVEDAKVVLANAASDPRKAKKAAQIQRLIEQLEAAVKGRKTKGS